MKRPSLLIPFFVLAFLFTSCSKEDDLVAEEQEEQLEKTRNLEVEDFIYRAMNDYYLYKAEVPELADNYFSGSSAKNQFLGSFDSPTELYEGVQASHDKFSFMTDDYVALENMFRGVSKSNGMEYVLGKITGTNNVFGIVRYVVPGSSADKKGIKRGNAFTEIDGKQLTTSNYQQLLGADSYDLRISRITDDGNGNSIGATEVTVRLVKEEFTENPVLVSKVLEIEDKRIGYIMYNGFTRDFDDELNAAFAELKAQMVTNLILDLRYNSGGDVESATDLASMITGQFEGQVFMQEQWNEKWQKLYETHRPEWLVNKFNTEIRTKETINSLFLDRIYILTTGSSASASELIINGLEPYIDVVQIGTNTAGKFQASTTLYDGEDFKREKATENHTYAVQPLILKSANAQGKSDYIDGLTPDIELPESISNYGILGDPSEPLLKAAINEILNRPQDQEASAMAKRASREFKIIGESQMTAPNYQRMYIDKAP